MRWPGHTEAGLFLVTPEEMAKLTVGTKTVEGDFAVAVEPGFTGPGGYAPLIEQPVAIVAAAPKPAIPLWVWLAGAGALVFFLFRR